MPTTRMKKDELLKKIKELERLEAERRKMVEADKPSPVKVSGMPLGCWLWIIGFMVAAYYGLTKLLE